MLTQEEAVEIKVLARQGKGIREIARDVGVSRNTVRRYLRGLAPSRRSPPKTQRVCKFDAFKVYLGERVRAAHPAWLPSPVLFSSLAPHSSNRTYYTIRITGEEVFEQPARAVLIPNAYIL